MTKVTMSKLKNRFQHVAKQSGQGMSEYIIIVALIAVVSIGVFSYFGQVIRNQVAGMAMELSGQNGSGAIANAQSAAKSAASAASTQRKMSDYGTDNIHS